MNTFQLNKARREAQCCTYFLGALADKTADPIDYARSTGPLARVVALFSDVHAAGESTKITVKTASGVTLLSQFTVDDTYGAETEIDLSANIDVTKSVTQGELLVVDLDYTAGGGPTPAAGLKLRVYTS